MFKNLLRPDSPLMITISQLTDCIFLSLFWILGCFPVVTIGASFAALYDSTFRGFRKQEKNSWQRFLKTFRGSWKQGIVPTVLVGAGFWGLLKVMIALWNMAALGHMSMMIFSGCALIGVLAVGILSLVFPVLSRFENTLGGLVKNTVFLAMANLPRTLGLGLINTVAGFLCLRFIVPMFFLPSLAALIGSLMIEPMFKPYLPESNEDAA